MNYQMILQLFPWEATAGAKNWILPQGVWFSFVSQTSLQVHRVAMTMFPSSEQWKTTTMSNISGHSEWDTSEQ